MILFVNACLRRESRTKRLAEALLSLLHDEVKEVDLSTAPLPILNEEGINERGELCKAEQYDHPLLRYAAEFAQADTVVIAAPYWDLSFPAVLKRYIEAISVVGITFRYSNEGIPLGMCRAKKVYYVTTAGGPFLPDYGFDYIRGFCTTMLGISECVCFSAENLDIWGADVEAILQRAEAEIREYFHREE